MGTVQVSNSKDFESAFVVCFGMSAYLCIHVWDEIDDALSNGAMISHLLWALVFLKVQGMEAVVVVMVNMMQKTCKKWLRLAIEEIYSLTYVSVSHLVFYCCIILTFCFILQIKWDNQFDDRIADQCCSISLDGTDFHIQEPSPFNPMW